MRRTIYLTYALLAIFAAGCSSKDGGSGNSGGNNFGENGVPPITVPDDIINLPGGETAQLSLNKAALDSYIGWTTNNPSNLRVTINLTKQGDYARAAGGVESGFGGYISIQFTDNNQNYLDSFTSLWLGTGNCGQYGDCNTVKDNVQNHRYNLASYDYPQLGGNLGYHGFFEDVRLSSLRNPECWYNGTCYQPKFGGGIVLVIDSTNDNGDGQGPTSANGSVWFKNYSSTTGQLFLTNCWFISAGPFDCRAWTTSDNNKDPVKYPLNHKQSIYPNNGYVKLGDFIGLDIKKAFNNQI